MAEFELIWGLVKGRSRQEVAKLSAYLLAPGLVLLGAVAGVNGHPWAIGVDRPVAISELRTELADKGSYTSRRGVALILEPVESEYRIQLGAGGSRIWSSLDETTTRANSNRLVLDHGGLSGKTPFLGVAGPVAVVIEGELGSEIQVPGGTIRVDDWRLPSQRSLSIVSSVLFACVFAFGLSLATGLPSTGGDKNATS